jgi:succinate-semialdehyde dehydrogenase/glutarate-semialdehyde dehydrogenase
MMSLNLDSIENEVLTAPEDVYELAGGAAEVPRVLAAARRAAAWWRTLSVKERASWLLRFRRELVDRLDEIVAVVGQEINKPRFDAINEVMQCGLLIGCHARRGPKILRSRRLTPGLQWNKRAAIHYRPLGVVGCITPWNYPVALPLMSAVPALLAGNAVILKPSRLALRTALCLQEAFNALGPPEPVFQVLAGDRATGVALAGSGVDKLVFVGGSRGARAIAQAAAARFTPLLLELGGNDPMIVAADADVERAAQAAAWGAFFNAGQSCVAIERCYVDRTIAEPFIERVVEIARGLSQGFSAVTAPESLPGPDWDHDLGPIRTAEHLAEVRELLADAIAQGAVVRCGGAPAAADDHCFPPTVLTNVHHGMRIMREEVFAPLLPIMAVCNMDEAIALANDTPYGLSASIWTRNRRQAWRWAEQFHTGGVAINDCLVHFGITEIPFGGVRQSGFGRVGGREGLWEFCATQSVVEHRFGMRLPFHWFPYRDKHRWMARIARWMFGSRSSRR